MQESQLNFGGSPTWDRTRDLRINSPSLYRLSYRGMQPHIIKFFRELSKSGGCLLPGVHYEMARPKNG